MTAKSNFLVRIASEVQSNKASFIVLPLRHVVLGLFETLRVRNVNKNALLTVLSLGHVILAPHDVSLFALGTDAVT